MNMNERIARALARHSYAGASDADIDAMWECWTDAATAAIQAMRNPTPEMIEAMYECYSWSSDPLQHWQAMIDAALLLEQ